MQFFRKKKKNLRTTIFWLFHLFIWYAYILASKKVTQLLTRETILLPSVKLKLKNIIEITWDNFISKDFRFIHFTNNEFRIKNRKKVR